MGSLECLRIVRLRRISNGNQDYGDEESMPILNSLAKVVAKPLPRMVSPEAHAVVDYITIGSFLMSAGYFWQRNKRAALAALICGGAGAVCENGHKSRIGFPSNRRK